MSKTLAALFLSLLPLAAYGPEPSELTSLRQNWQAARRQATEPVDRKYLDALAALKLKLTQAGNLEQALRVEEEIKSMEPQSQLPPSTLRQPLTQGELTAARWSFVVPGSNWIDEWTFATDGGLASKRGVRGGSWKITSRCLRVEFKDGTVWNEFSLEPDRSGGKLVLKETTASDRKGLGTLTRTGK